MTSALSRVDHAAFRLVARSHLPGGDRVLPRLSRSANHGVLWFGTAALIAASGLGGRHTARRAALRGTASLALASAAVNVFAKRAVRRTRPILDAVPLIRQLHRPPFTTSFPSGHTASSAAFATGVALESRGWGAAVAPLAGAVAFSRVYTGAHYPTDVVAGAALGVAAAYTVRRLLPPPEPVPARRHTPAVAPRLSGGEGLVVVANPSSGPAGQTPEQLRRSIAELLPRAEVLVYGHGTREERGSPDGAAAGGDRNGDGDGSGPGDGPGLAELLHRAARRAAAHGGALGVSGGDGTVSAAAGIAVRYGLPLAVMPAGTLNHFAHDLGVHTLADTRDALNAGEAVAADLARSGAPATQDRHGGHDAHHTFVNTLALGVYPELVRLRRRWSPRIGHWPAGVLAAWRVLRICEPVEVRINGTRRQLWLLFAGNCRYQGLGFARQRRAHLADGLLDVRVARAGRWARTRLLTAALTGTLYRSPAHGAALLRRLRVDWVEPGTPLAYDGEVTDAPGSLLLSKMPAALRVYCPHRPRPDVATG
jgi:undecaprenyl-diphosphatase